MATFYAGMRHYIQALNNLAAIAGLDTFTFSLANDDAISWAGATSTDVHDCLKLDTSDDFNVGLLTAPGSGGALKWWANGAEKARILATGALLVGATSAIAGETILANVAAITPVSNTVVGVLASGAGQSTATTSIRGFESRVTTAASAFTATEVSHFKATGAAAGAGSTITSLYGVKVDNAAAVGTNNYAFWTDFASASNKYAIYASGTAASYLGGPLRVAGTNTDSYLALGVAATNHFSTATTIYGALLGFTAPSSATTAVRGFYSDIRTAAAAFTVPSLTHFFAASSTKGAGSTITSVYGFRAANAIAVGTNNYGFYSDIANASNTYQIFLGGTGSSYLAGRVGIAAAASAAAMLAIAPISLVSDAYAYCVSAQGISPTTATSVWGNYLANSTVPASTAFLTVINFYSYGPALGAGASVANVYGFRAGSTMAVGTNNYGFHSDIASASNTYQLYMAGTALNRLKGGLILDTTAAPTVAAGQIGFGATVQTTVGAAGGASALPATPTGYMIINVAGTNRVLPYYAAA